ncbi:hypothetical protein [Phytomonospora endophytica]|uniref:Uncharacterized protein n=1 Tax=Phytomonospora endophytica TaxID=714109 RepID=A0A841FER9_9ACTN|nr:hypothetical protein [Phytomonospora endophytica]MBB6033493.1 hypothetical protein [Phytomonospora endophytica]GIG64990.1 hypothetical protein Pen01_12850 [Phytomonospora endophytica]
MEGVLPISLSLSDDSARLIGAYVRSGLIDVVRPPLDSIDAQLNEIRTVLRLMTLNLVDTFGSVFQSRLRVEVMNEDLLDHIEATRWAVAYLSYNKFLELLDHIAYMRWLDGRSHIHLHDIIGRLVSLETLVAIFATEQGGIGAQIIGLLEAILAKLNEGIGVNGTIQIIVTGADPLAELDLLKLLGLLGLLALGLAIIVAFLFGVGAALATFTAAAIPAAIAIGLLVAGLIPLMNALANFDWEQLAKIGAGFLGIAGFVALLGKAFQQITSDLAVIVPQLKTFFEAITALMTAIAGFDWEQLGKIAAGFAGIALFVAALGKAFQQFTTDLGTVIPHLNTFFESITKLMTALAGFDWSQLGRIAVGFLAIAVFVALLGKAFQQFTTDLSTVIPHLNTFFDSITKLMTAIAGFDWSQLGKIAVGFLLIAGFVALLGIAFRQFTTDLGQVIPHLNTFFDSITKLMTAIAGFDWTQLAKIAVGFLLIAGFVWLLGKALATLTEQAISALEPLAKFFTAITQMMQAIAAFSVGQMFQIAAGFLLIAGFVYLLALALNTLTAQAVSALPGLTGLIAALSQLAATLGAMTAGDMVAMGIGLALIAGFVWAVAAALVYAAGPLATLASLFGSLGSVLGVVSSIGSMLGGVLSGLGGIVGDVLGGIGDAIGSLGGLIGDVAGSVIGGVTDVISGAAGLVGDAASGMVDLAGDAIGGIGDAIGGVGDFLFGEDEPSVPLTNALPSAAAPPPPPPAATAAPAGLGALASGGALAAPAAGGSTAVDQTVNAGGINISISAERLEADSASLLTDDIIAQLQARLGALRSTQDFQAGARPAAA